MVLVLQLGLRALGTRANSLGVVSIKRTARLSVEELGAILIDAGDQQRDAKGPGRDAVLAVGALAEAEGEIADGLGAGLNAE